MIIEGLLNIIFSILTALFETLPNISWETDTGAMNTFLGFISVISYLLPMDTILHWFSFILTIIWFRIVIAIVKTIWDLLPLV